MKDKVCDIAKDKALITVFLGNWIIEDNVNIPVLLSGEELRDLIYRFECWREDEINSN